MAGLVARFALSMVAGSALDKLYDHFFGQKGNGSKRAGSQNGAGKSKPVKSLSRAHKIQAVAKELGKLPHAKQIALIKSKS